MTANSNVVPFDVRLIKKQHMIVLYNNPILSSIFDDPAQTLWLGCSQIYLNHLASNLWTTNIPDEDKCLRKQKEATKNGQSNDTGNIGHKTQNDKNQKDDQDRPHQKSRGEPMCSRNINNYCFIQDTSRNIHIVQPGYYRNVACTPN